MKLHTWEDAVWRRDPLERAHQNRLRQDRQDTRLDYLMDRMADLANNFKPRFVGDQLTTKHLEDVLTEMFELDARRTDEGYGDVPAARMIHEFNEVVRAYQHEHYLAGTHAPMFFLAHWEKYIAAERKAEQLQRHLKAWAPAQGEVE